MTEKEEADAETVAEIAKQMEQSASEECSQETGLPALAPATPVPQYMTIPPIQGVGVLPLSDLRERLEMLRKARVAVYRDGPVEIRIDTDKASIDPNGSAGEVTRF